MWSQMFEPKQDSAEDRVNVSSLHAPRRYACSHPNRWGEIQSQEACVPKAARGAKQLVSDVLGRADIVQTAYRCQRSQGRFIELLRAEVSLLEGLRL